MGQCASRERSAVGPRPLSDIEAARAWLECIDCEGPFLKRLADLPAARRDSVVRFLGTALREGPDSARTARHERELMRIWASDSAYRFEVDAEEASANQRTAFFKRYRQGFETKWRGRAAIALGVIRSPSALAALDSALTAPLVSPGDSIVQRWVERARSDSAGPEAIHHYP